MRTVFAEGGCEELKWRTRVLSSPPAKIFWLPVREWTFLDGQAALMLVAARLRYVLSHQWGTKKYMNTEPLHEAELQQTAS
ncbi:hypothetical protein [Aminomonas paucivorans]|uniref:hypothetical protein n=1 Tax=Aminomonas paucivorans TaxID=81412 RepID=UPI0018DD1EDE